MSQVEEARKRSLDHLNADFVPVHLPTAMAAPEMRIASALEFIAYRLGRIDTTLRQIGENVAIIQAKTP